MEFNYTEHSRWMGDNGDDTHRLNYEELKPKSTVVDVGGYLGEWSEKIKDKYNPNIYILEPIHSYYEGLVKKFGEKDKIKIFNFGLSSSSGKVKINLDNASSSLYKPGTGSQEVEISTVDSFMKDNSIEEIDLMKINIEGSEFDLLEDIIQKGLQSKIKNYQIQFHVFVENCESRRNFIRKELSKTHECVYNYDYIWEGWRIKR